MSATRDHPVGCAAGGKPPARLQRLAIAAALSIVWSSAAQAACVPARGPYAATAPSSGGRFTATISSSDVMLNQATRLAIKVAKADGTPLAPTATVQVRLLMLAHGHGMTTRPFLKRVAADAFEADGILLHMPGEWTLFLDIAEGPVTEKIMTCLVV